MIEGANRPFGKYERFGAYHWREVEPLPTMHNAVLTARYRVLLDAMGSGVRRVLDIGAGTERSHIGLPSEPNTSGDRRLAAAAATRGRRVRSAALFSPSVADECRRPPSAVSRRGLRLRGDGRCHRAHFAPDAVMSEAYRVLSKGGQILLTTPRRQGALPSHEYHCHEYTGVEFADLLRHRFSGVYVRPFQPIRSARLYEQKVFGRKLFRIAINCCAIAGWNPLARSGDISAEARHTDLCAWGRKP